jgi:hypothetical protein
VHAARHQRFSVGENDVFAITPRERHQGAIRRPRFSE